MCGIIGIIGHEPVNQQLFDGLTVLQHRGQDAAGIVTCDDHKLYLRKRNGLVRDVFHTRHMKKLVGTMGIGHVRYPTAGSSSSAEAQPLYVNSPYGIALGHNGNLNNADQLKKELFLQDRRHLNTTSDSEILLNIVAQELQKLEGFKLTPEGVFNAVANVHKRVTGAYAVINLIVGQGILAFRDPNGIRPVVYGKRETQKGTEYIIASETAALDALGYELIADLAPGEAIFIDTDLNVSVQQCAENPKLVPCIFEHVYFARPDSVIDDIFVHKARMRMGVTLAEHILETWSDHDIDVVIPVPETSRTSAVELGLHLGVKFREGFIKNRYIGRTFIMPGQEMRKKSVRQKLNAIDLEFKDKNVLLVDDSIVRGTTSEEIVQMARDAGARKVYFASAAPPIRYRNIYGIDMPAVEDLIAHGRTEEEVCEAIGADRIVYQTLEGLKSAVSAGNPDIHDFECSVFTGEYVTGISQDYLESLENSRGQKSKKKKKKQTAGIDLHNSA